MKTKLFATALAIGFAAIYSHASSQAASDPPASKRAVLVELFTSEGCSSCPPADALLESLDRANSRPNFGDQPETIVLSEHVDYWNHIGWTDPYSSSQYSNRQSVYASRFHLDSVYTPQMVVDGGTEFVGNDARRAKSAIAEASRSEKTAVRIIPVADSDRVRIEVDALQNGLKRDADVYLALASNEATTQVLRGENGGRQLHHVAVVRRLSSIGSIHSGMAFSKEVTAPAAGEKAGPMRIVAFVQEHGQGKILGAAILRSSKNKL